MELAVDKVAEKFSPANSSLFSHLSLLHSRSSTEFEQFLSNQFRLFTDQMYVHNYNSHKQQHHVIGDRFRRFVLVITRTGKVQKIPKRSHNIQLPRILEWGGDISTLYGIL